MTPSVHLHSINRHSRFSHTETTDKVDSISSRDILWRHDQDDELTKQRHDLHENVILHALGAHRQRRRLSLIEVSTSTGTRQLSAWQRMRVGSNRFGTGLLGL